MGTNSIKLELFTDTGFVVDDKVYLIIRKKTYYGQVLEIDQLRNRILVDYTTTSKQPVIDWFKCSFWKKIETTQKFKNFK